MISISILVPLLLPLIGGLIDALTLRKGYILAACTFATALLLSLALFHVASLVPYSYPIAQNVILKIASSTFWLALAVVTLWIGFLIVVYSIGYMWLDYRRGWFWFFVGLMLTCTLLLLFSQDLLTLIIAWDGMELCSYALIGHWYRDEPERHVGEGFTIGGFRHLWSPSSAALRAVVITSIGTACLLVAAALAYARYHTLDFANMGTFNVFTAALVIVAALATCAQLPFTEWLFTAMAGPTPVSALIHSITLVNAGAYLIFKLAAPLHGSHVLTFASLFVLTSVVLMGLTGLASREVKVILAASTCIYVGLLLYDAVLYAMTLSPLCLTCAILILIGHGFSKASLFTSCGYLMHMAGTRFVDDVKVMLRYRQSYLALVLASLNLFGIVIPSAGFLFKELLVDLSSTVQAILILLSTAISIGLLMKLILYFRMLRREATVIEHVEAHELTMEYACLALAVGPYVLFVPYANLLPHLLTVERVLVTYLIFAVALFLSISLFRNRNKIPQGLLYLLKTRFGLAVLFDYCIASAVRAFSRAAQVVSTHVDRALHAGWAYLKAMRGLYSADKVLDKLLHVYLPRAMACASRSLARVHIDKLLNYMIIASIILIVVIVYVTFLL